MANLSQHARDQMKARDISESEVDAVLAAPEITAPGRPGPLGPTKVLRKTVNGRRLKVVVSDTEVPRVVTVASPDE